MLSVAIQQGTSQAQTPLSDFSFLKGRGDLARSLKLFYPSTMVPVSAYEDDAGFNSLTPNENQ